MKKSPKRIVITVLIVVLVAALAVVASFVFFDEALITRKGTIYRVRSSDKVVALTFDDGPSPEWTPQILDALKKADVKATFFMLGQHAVEYPEIAKRVVAEGHEIGNHSYSHHVLLFYRHRKLQKEIRDGEKAIKDVTGVTTTYFRPPKSWLTDHEKNVINAMGYKIVLWSLNSKDWVTFDDKYMIPYLANNARPGDIILFHDGGGLFKPEGGDRSETVKTIPGLVERLRAKGYRFVTITELLGDDGNGGAKH
ncbi:MAG TPA: polysaccharide deacetylase family protein [Candidatus Bathyarchaeia archaeon]|nr:polysaccharide deacetylase family protein [Candidatus Bathyarchaeia archaeon]